MSGQYKPRQLRARLFSTDLPVAAGLYVLAALLLLFKLDSHPGFTTNWENDTLYGLFPFVERPSLEIFKLREGLMTDSGSLPWSVLPAWAGYGLAGPSLLSLRMPVALVAALAVPLLYLLARKIAPGRVVALTGSLLLALSPVYLVYARTATAVGVSLVPALLAALALLAVLDRPGRWRALLLLGALLLGAYGYAPVRFLWPICVGLLVLEAFICWRYRARRLRLLGVAAFLVVGMAGLITELDFNHGHDLLQSVLYYYSGRGEQFANLLANTAEYNQLLGPAGLSLVPSTQELAWAVFSRNMLNMANLFLDRHTMPAVTDFWNPHGRLIPWWMMPLLVVGFVCALGPAVRKAGGAWRVPVALSLGFTLPMLLTSQVHIGRLIFAVPFICFFVALGMVVIAEAAVRVAVWLRKGGSSGHRRRLLAGAAALALVGMTALSTWQDYSVPIPPTYEELVGRVLRGGLEEVEARGGGAALVAGSDEARILEEINAGHYRLMLRDAYLFYNLATGDLDVRRPGDTRPPLYVGGLLDRLKEPQTIPGYCRNVYYVRPDHLERFEALLEENKGICEEPVIFHRLP